MGEPIDRLLDSEGERWECPVCRREMMGPDEACAGHFGEPDHPLVRAVPNEREENEEAER